MSKQDKPSLPEYSAAQNEAVGALKGQEEGQKFLDECILELERANAEVARLRKEFTETQDLIKKFDESNGFLEQEGLYTQEEMAQNEKRKKSDREFLAKLEQKIKEGQEWVVELEGKRKTLESLTSQLGLAAGKLQALDRLETKQLIELHRHIKPSQKN